MPDAIQRSDHAVPFQSLAIQNFRRLLFSYFRLSAEKIQLGIRFPDDIPGGNPRYLFRHAVPDQIAEFIGGVFDRHNRRQVVHDIVQEKIFSKAHFSMQSASPAETGQAPETDPPVNHSARQKNQAAGNDNQPPSGDNNPAAQERRIF